MHCAKFGYLPLEKGEALYLNKLESPYHKDVCAKFGRNLLSGSEEDFLIPSMYFTFSSLSLLGKEWGPSFEQT